MKNEIIAKLKSEYPTLTKGEDDQVITLSAEEYESVISSWADAELERQAKELAEAEALAAAQAQKQAILDRLGLTEDELRIVLGQRIIL